MIGFSKLCPVKIGRSLVENFKYSQTYQRRGHTLNIKGIDRESYMNKKNVKNKPVGRFSLIVPMTCFGLAIWQVDRKMWKDRLCDDMKLRTKIPGVELPEDLTNRRKLEYRRFRVRGTFDHSKEILVGPRSKIVNQSFTKSKSFLIPFGDDPDAKPDIGFLVVTPFKLADRNLTILVNRGWVPMDKRSVQYREEGQIDGIVELEGILRLTEPRPMYLGSVKPESGVLRYRNLSKMVEMTGSSYVYLDAVVESTVPGGPIGGQTQVNLKNDHLEYIITWTLMGLLTAYMWHKRFVRKVH